MPDVLAQLTRELRGDALRVGLKEIFTNHSFYICKLEELCEMACVHPPEDTMQALHVLHCVSYSKMSSDMQERLFATVMAIFSVPAFNLNLIDALADEVAFNQAGSPSVMRPALEAFGLKEAEAGKLLK